MKRFRGNGRRPKDGVRRRLQLEPLEHRALMTATPTISLTRDTSAGGFGFWLQGAADPGAIVRVDQVGMGTAGATTADRNGHWSIHVADAQLANGEFRFRAAAQSADNLSSASADAIYRPNFVLVNTDDMAAHDLRYMPQVNKLLGGSGTTFTNSFVPTALSGPSRAALLTGQYAHSNGGFETFAPWGGAANYNAATALPNLLHGVGYRTAAFGKNETSPDHLESSRPGDPPPGWDEFSTGARNPDDPSINGYFYYRNGIRTVVPEEPGGSTYVWTKLAESFIERSSPGDSPFLLYFAPIITHQPYSPAPWHLGTLNGVEKWRPPSYNIVPSDIINLDPKTNLSGLDATRQRHLETLLAVDESVGRLYHALESAGELDNTIFVFTSDNGLMWGEHALFSLKNNFFDEALRVPLVIRDGRQPGKHVASQMVLNIDIAPTLAQLGGVALPAPVDGRDLMPAIHGDPTELRSAFIVEHQWTEGYDIIDQGFGAGGVGIRTNTWKYVEYRSGKRDLFDLARDPYEMHNLGNHPAYAARRQQLAAQMRGLLPADRAGPIISSLTQFIEFDEKGVPYIRIAGEETDADSGGSPVRTPEYFIDHVGFLGWGEPLDHADGAFDAVVENFQRRLPLMALTPLAAGNHTLYVRGRDVIGNWGPLRSRKLTLLQPPQLDTASDTGNLHGDGLTVNRSPTIRGVAEPGASIALFTVRPMGHVVSLGTARASAAGIWTKTLSLVAGEQHVMAVITSASSPTPRLTAALTIHVAGVIADGKLQIVGSASDDVIVANATTQGKVNVLVGGVLAGAFTWSGPVVIDGLGGNDHLTLRGSLAASLNGGAGDDVLIGGAGNDVLRGDAGKNLLQGGAGDDRYVFTQPAAKSENVLTEYVGRGYDTLDFRLHPGAFELTFGATPLARTFASRYETTVRAAAGTPLSYEAIWSSGSGGLIKVPSTVRVVTSGGDERITLQNAVPPGEVILRTLSLGSGSNAQLRCLLTVNQGLLRLSAEPGGVTASQIIGNGTNRVELTGTRAQINTTLRASTRLRVPTIAAGSKLVVDLKLRPLSSDTVLEHSTTTLTVSG